MFMDAFLYHQCFCTENHEKRVPLNIILQSKLLSKDENIRKKGFCAETGKIGITGTASETGKPGKIGEIAKAPVSRRFALFIFF